MNDINHGGVLFGNIIQNRNINIGPISDRIEENCTGRQKGTRIEVVLRTHETVLEQNQTRYSQANRPFPDRRQVVG